MRARLQVLRVPRLLKSTEINSRTIDGALEDELTSAMYNLRPITWSRSPGSIWLGSPEEQLSSARPRFAFDPASEQYIGFGRKAARSANRATVTV